jgi:hypothetical protein
MEKIERVVARANCYQCGMSVVGDRCPKCDSVIADQTDGSTEWVDIAHAGQTVTEALRELDRELKISRLGLTKFLGLIVGNGKIRLEVLARLGDLEFRREIQGVSTNESNPGQIIVQLKA